LERDDESIEIKNNMITIKRKGPLSSKEINVFLENINFELPKGFIEFYEQSNGGILSGENVYVDLWPLPDMIALNKNYEVDKYAPDFFIFGSDDGGTAYCIEKKTAFIYDMQFIGMPEDARFICKNFNEFLQSPEPS
jgi:hypothetical protein